MSKSPPKVPELHHMTDAPHAARAVLDWAEDFLQWIYNYQVPHLVKPTAFPLEMEHYVIITDNQSQIREIRSNLAENEASAPSQSAPGSTA